MVDLLVVVEINMPVWKLLFSCAGQPSSRFNYVCVFKACLGAQAIKHCIVVIINFKNITQYNCFE